MVKHPAPDRFSHKKVVCVKQDKEAVYREKLEFYKKLRADLEILSHADLCTTGNSTDNPIVVEIYDELPSTAVLRRNWFKVDPDTVKKVDS